MNYNTKQSGERIRLLRIRAGLAQEKTANALNIDQSYYGRIETGKKGCSVDLFIQLAELFADLVERVTVDPGHALRFKLSGGFDVTERLQEGKLSRHRTIRFRCVFSRR